MSIVLFIFPSYYLQVCSKRHDNIFTVQQSIGPCMIFVASSDVAVQSSMHSRHRAAAYSKRPLYKLTEWLRKQRRPQLYERIRC